MSEVLYYSNNCIHCKELLLKLAKTKKRNEIYFASDAQGEKKLFYFNNDDYLIISSTISSILVVLGEKKLNLEWQWEIDSNP